MLLLPEPAAEVGEPLLNVLGRALAENAPEPPWVAVDDGRGAWLLEVAARPPHERANALIAAASEETLANGHRLGIGGAVWLPPSTPAMVTGLARAGACRPSARTAVDHSLFASGLSPGQRLAAVTWANRHFWMSQLGDGVLTELLFELAAGLGVLPTIMSWPALLVVDRPVDEIHSRWQVIAEGRRDVPFQGLEIAEAEWPAQGFGALLPEVAKALMAIERSTRRADIDRSCPPRPVCALPSGELLGRWSPVDCATQSSGRWLALPEIAAETGYRWRLQKRDGEQSFVEEVMTSEAARSCEGPAVRVPGWIARSLRPGAPAGLLVERLARAARQTGKVLWVPNVDSESLRFLLRLATPLWVDGTAVPES